MKMLNAVHEVSQLTDPAHDFRLSCDLGRYAEFSGMEDYTCDRAAEWSGVLHNCKDGLPVLLCTPCLIHTRTPYGHSGDLLQAQCGKCGHVQFVPEDVLWNVRRI